MVFVQTMLTEVVMSIVLHSLKVLSKETSREE